jgi:hypothetical protein
MKFLIVLSVFALSASQVTPFFFGGHGKKPAAAPAPAPAPVPVAAPVAAPSSSGGGGGLGGLGNILA